MASLPVRDPVGDHLLTPQNAGMVVVDYQPFQFSGVQSVDRDLLPENIVSTVKIATSVEAHRAGLERVVQAGGKPIGWVSSRQSFSATGHARRRRPASARSCSPNGC
jgi:hypothetical protein